MHLTNYSVNKKSQQFVRNTDAARDDEGSKWSLSALYKHLESEGVDITAMQARPRLCARTMAVFVVDDVKASASKCAPGALHSGGGMVFTGPPNCLDLDSCE